jgi:integrase
MSLGTYPQLLIPLARAKHAELWAKVKSAKGDPLGERQAAKAAAAAPAPTGTPTFGEIADQYIATHEASWKNARHRDQWRLTLGEHCGLIRSKPVDEIDTAAVLRVLKPIWVKTPETGSRLRGRIETVLNAARSLGHIDENRANPARWKGHLDTLLPNPKKVGKRGHHAAMPYADVPAFMARLKKTPSVTTKALMFVILTAARSGEVFGMKLDEAVIAIATGVWTVPGERMKTGKEHSVPLSNAAIAILKERFEARGPKQVYVFESPVAQGSRVHRDGAHQPLSPMALAMLMRRDGAGVTVHGFRSSFRSWAADRGFAFEVAEQCLAHAVGNAVVQAYQRSSMVERRRPVMEEWGRFVTGDGEAAKVVPLAAAKGRGKRH